MIDKIKISVVTVCYNAVTAIEETIESVVNQTYPNIEYIIIDGGSRDGTVDVIKKYEDKISYWVSEPDKGIYDAMNKGIDVATGEWINFMNAGDTFYDVSVLDKIFQYYRGFDDVLYGDTIAKYSFGNTVYKAYPIEFIKKQIPFCHQSSFVRVSIAKALKFDLTYRLCADYNMFYSLFFKGAKFKYTNIIISVYESEQGFSSSNAIGVKREYGHIQGRSNSLIWKMYIKLYSFYLSITFFFKHIIPKSIISFYHKQRYLNNESHIF